MKTMILSLIAALTAAMLLAVGASAGDTRVCWNYYNKAWENMRHGDHNGYNKWMAKYNHCMNAAWEGPVPKKKKKHNM